MKNRKKTLFGLVFSVLLLGILSPLFSPSLTVNAQTDGYIEVFVYDSITLDPIFGAQVELYDENYNYITMGGTNIDGFYNFTGLGVGGYWVEAWLGNYEWSSFYVTIDYDGEGEYLEIPLVKIFIAGDGFIDVYVYGSDTLAPIEDAEVDLFSLNYYWIHGGMTDVDGFYNLTGLGAATYIVSASADGYEWDNTYITIDYDGEGEYWLFYLDPIFIPGTGFIDVYVYGMDTLAPIEDAYVDLFNDEWYWITGGLTDISGFYNFTGLGAATYIIEANAADYEWNEAYVTIDYDGEGESITIFLPPSFVPGDGFIDTYVYNNDTHNPIEGAGVRLYDEYDNFIDMGYTDISGFYNFTGLGVSGYRIEAEASSYGYNESYVIIDYDGEGEYLELYLPPIIRTINILYPSDSQTIEGGMVLVGFDASEPYELETINVYVNGEYVTTIGSLGGGSLTEFIVPVFENGTNTIELEAYWYGMSVAYDTVVINSVNVIPTVDLKEGDILNYHYKALSSTNEAHYNFTFTEWISPFEMNTTVVLSMWDDSGPLMDLEYWMIINVLNGYVSVDPSGEFLYMHFFPFGCLLPDADIGDITALLLGSTS